MLVPGLGSHGEPLPEPFPAAEPLALLRACRASRSRSYFGTRAGEGK